MTDTFQSLGSAAIRATQHINDQWHIHHMGGLERASADLEAKARDIAHHIRCLKGLPAYETNGEEALDKAILTLNDTLMAAKVARAELKRKRHQKVGVAA